MPTNFITYEDYIETQLHKRLARKNIPNIFSRYNISKDNDTKIMHTKC